MPGHKYVSNNGSLFEDDDDDIDDETFLKNAPPSRASGAAQSSSTNPFVDDLQQQRQLFEQRRKEVEQNTLQSASRSLGLLRESESVGIATAEELTKQREQLQKTSQQLDEINATLRFSQKHLNGLKSVFGGLKNYLSGSKDTPPTRMSSSPSGSKMSETTSPPMSPDDRYNSHPIARMRDDSLLQQQQQMESGSFNSQLDRNLDEMAGSLSRLKGLAIDLNQEIDSQNDLIDDITNKVEDVDVKIGRQNKDMNKLLGKK